METLNTPNEIALWSSAAAAYVATCNYPNADSAAQFADSMVLELRKRIPAAGLSGDPEPTHMTRADILRVALHAHTMGEQVRVYMDDGKTHIASIVTIEHDSGSALPIEFGCDALTWEYLACEREPNDPTEESGDQPMVSRLELV
jgi:hypothetical protein